MSRRLSRLVAPVVAALIAVASIIGVVGGTNIRWEALKANQRPSIAVLGDSTSYVLYDALLPCPRHDTTGTAGDLYQAYCADTLIFNVGSCDKIRLYGRWDGDSVAYWVDWSFDARTWTAVIDSTFVNGTPSRTWTPVTSDWAQKVNTQLINYPPSGSGAGVDTTFDNFLWRVLRVRMLNMDADSFYIDGGPSHYGDNAAADTVINVEWTVYCGE